MKKFGCKSLPDFHNLSERRYSCLENVMVYNDIAEYQVDLVQVLEFIMNFFSQLWKHIALLTVSQTF